MRNFSRVFSPGGARPRARDRFDSIILRRDHLGLQVFSAVVADAVLIEKYSRGYDPAEKGQHRVFTPKDKMRNFGKVFSLVGARPRARDRFDSSGVARTGTGSYKELYHVL